MKIAIASDHAGYSLKETLKSFLQKEGYNILDFGCDSEDRCDYPDFAAKASYAVAKGDAVKGVLVCGSGIGMCMTANRFEGIRAAVLRSPDDAVLSRRHNDANIACLGGRISTTAQAQSLLKTFFETEFEKGRHIGRIQKIDEVKK